VWSETGPLRYERLTWPAVRRAAGEDRVALVPVATLEDHGPHLPVDTDLRIVSEICERAAARAAARLVMVDRPEVLAAAAFYLASPKAFEVIGRVRKSTRGGMAHACELETSIYLATDERSYPEGEHAWLDWSDGPLKLMPWWSSFSRSGVQGDATLGTAEKGQALLEAAVDECLAYVDELRAKPLPERRPPVAGAGSGLSSGTGP
jgi:creatinine amidohydrolase/Fe(II)-dependent formamide hydrolase-like protein